MAFSRSAVESMIKILRTGSIACLLFPGEHAPGRKSVFKNPNTTIYIAVQRFASMVPWGKPVNGKTSNFLCHCASTHVRMEVDQHSFTEVVHVYVGWNRADLTPCCSTTILSVESCEFPTFRACGRQTAIRQSQERHRSHELETSMRQFSAV